MFRAEPPGLAAVEGLFLAPDEGIGTNLVRRPPSVSAPEVSGIEDDAAGAYDAARKTRNRGVLRIDESRGPRLRLGVVIAQVRVDFTLLALPRRIDDPVVLYRTAVQDPPHDEFTRTMGFLSILREIRVFDIPGADQGAGGSPAHNLRIRSVS